MDTDVLIVGGGLAGLSLAVKLHRSNRRFLLVEARNRFGGRIKTERLADGYFDMGPAWFWPGQPRIAALIDELGLRKFEQYADGILSFEDETGQVQRGCGYASMQGSYRLQGGLGALTDVLAKTLPESALRTGRSVTALSRSEGGIISMLSNGDTIKASQVVMALPPRVAADQITFAPALSGETLQAMSDVETWMAGQAKAVAVYDTPFWREAGLSGDAMSRRGPIVEVHDASPVEGGPFALFGFIGVPPDAREDEEALRAALLVQLERLFGPEAARPKALYVKDWAFDPYTATKLDRAPRYTHPQYGLPQAMTGLWDQSLVFGGTEVASQFGGYLEGALEAAENAVDMLDKIDGRVAHDD